LAQGRSRPPHEDLIAEELRLAAWALGRLTGRVDVEDVLDVIFRDFCIGK
jgi:tRNA modification GTPase